MKEKEEFESGGGVSYKQQKGSIVAVGWSSCKFSCGNLVGEQDA